MRWPIAAVITATLALFATAAEAQNPLPADSEYVVVRGGHLSVNGQRQRYWAAIGKLYSSSDIKPGDSAEVKAEKIRKARLSTDRLLDRFEQLSFNSFRLWTAVPDTEGYAVGDGSSADDVDYFIAQAKKKGFRIWTAGLNQTGNIAPSDVNIIDDPATAREWAEAIESMATKVGTNGKKTTAPVSIRSHVARFWDPRIEKLGIERMKAVATHTNKHTGLRWCNDPVFGVWELANEEWWMRKMVAGQWQKLPAFFRNSLIVKWNDFLATKYGGDERLIAAWGKLLPGESLASRSILLVPTAGKSKVAEALNDANEQAKAAITAVDTEYSRADFAPARGADVLEFFMGLQLAHKQREAAALKPLGKSLTLSPMIFDTGIGYEIQSQYLHQNADAVAHDAYVNGWGKDLAAEMAKVDNSMTEHLKMRAIQDAERISANSGRWVNWLLKPPGIHQGVPWLEHNKVEGKPYLCYETQIQQPAKYRADFPLRLAALASIQDWDWICWHYFATPNDLTGDNPFEKPMDVTVKGHPQGYHYTYDAVQAATMRSASEIFRNGLLKPVANPTKFIYGRKSLYNPDSMDYGGSYGIKGLDMNYTTYQHGVRIQIDPKREDDEVAGPVVTFADRNTHNPYTPTDQISFDHKKGFLRLDSPGAAAWTGLLARYNEQVKFENGVTLKNVQLHNPPESPDPVSNDEKYIAFALTSADGKPLDKTASATVTLVSTSYNSGFQLLPPGHKDGLSVPGKLPVLTTRVSATVAAPAINGMTYRYLDFHMREIGRGVVTNGELSVPADRDFYVIVLSR